MESTTALVAAGAAFALSFYIGHGRVSSDLFALIFGAVSGVGFAILFFVLSILVGLVLPGTFEAWSLGIHFIILVVAAPLGAAAIAVLAYRHAERVNAARLPF